MTHDQAMDIRDRVISRGFSPTLGLNEKGEYSVYVFEDRYSAVCGTACGFAPLQIIRGYVPNQAINATPKKPGARYRRR